MPQQNRIPAKGFTLIELVSVLTILSVLGSTAAPKLFSLANMAKETSVDITVAAFEKSIRMAQLACITSLGRNRDNLPGYGDGNVDFNNYCFPTDTNNQNIINGANARCLRVWNAVLNPPPSIQTGAAGNSTYRAFASGETCRYRYLDLTPPVEFTYDSLSGSVALLP